MWRSAWLLAVSLAGLAVGCKHDADPPAATDQGRDLGAVIAAHRGKATARLARLAHIAGEIQAAAPVTAVERDRLPAALTLAESLYADGDTLLMTPDLMVARAPGPPPAPRVVDRDPLAQLRRLLGEGEPARGDSAALARRELQRFEQLAYVFVVRVRVYRPPRLAPASAGKPRFAPGRVVGDAWLYRLDDGARLGAFPFDIVQDRSAYVQTTHRGEQAVRDLVDSLAVDVRRSLRADLQAFLRGRPVGVGSGPAARVEAFERDLVRVLGAALPAAGIRDVDLAIGGEHPIATIHADTPAVLAAAEARIQAITAQVVGDDSVVVKVLGNTK